MKCPQCGNLLVIDCNWRPPNGYDPRMRKWNCTGYQCDCEVFVSRKHQKGYKKDSDPTTGEGISFIRGGSQGYKKDSDPTTGEGISFIRRGSL